MPRASRTRSRAGQHDDHAFRTYIRAEAAPVAPFFLDRDLPVGYRYGTVSPVAAGRHATAAGCTSFGKLPDCDAVNAPGEGGMRPDAG